MNRILLIGITLLFFHMSKGYGQDRKISGKVSFAEDGSSLPGVSVSIKGTSIGTTTDSDGKYTLSIANNSNILVFSYIGMTSQEIHVGTRSIIDISMISDVKSLSEVIITGVVNKSSRSTGYSVGKVSGEELIKAKPINVATALSGKLAGLQISTINNGVNPTTRITLRGNRSFTGNNQALLVVDGMQVPQDAINYLNPNDIEDITVLKGANAAAIYGSDASNGALIITTKKGSGSTPKITVSNTTYLETVSFMPKFQNGFGAGTESYSRAYIPFENQSYGPAFDGSMRPVGRTLEDGSIQTLPYSALPDEKFKVWDKGWSTQNDVSLSAGDSKSNYYLSLQDVKTKGVVPKDENHRTTARLNASHTYGKLKAAFNVNYTLRQTERTTADFYNMVLNQPANIPLSSYKNWENLKNADGSMNFANPNNYFNDYYPNPYFALDNNRINERYGYLLGNVEFGYEFTSWLNVKYRLGLTNETYSNSSYTGKFTFTDFAKASGKTNAKDIAGSSGDAQGFRNRINQDIILTFKKTFGPISTNLVLGTHLHEIKRKYINVSANALVLPDLYTVGNRTGEPGAGQYYDNNRLVGHYADLTLGYKDWIFLHLSGRQDQTSVLAKNNRSFFYPSADVAFVLSDAVPALQGNIISSAKLTFGVSKVGNINVDPYQLQTTFSTGSFPYGSLAGFTIDGTYNDPGLQPEFTTSYEVGGDFDFLNQRLSLELAYYRQKTTNQTVRIDIANSTGYTGARVNSGAMQNDGYELTLKTTPVSTASGLEWDINFNYSYRDTKVLSLYGTSENINLSNYYGLTSDASLGQVFAEKGQQYPIMKAVAYQRDDQGRVVVNPQTGYPLKDPNLITVGVTNPKHLLGLSSTLRYKGVSLYALAEYRGGNVIYHGLASTMWFTGVAEATAAYGRERFVFPNSSYQAADGSYVANTAIATEDGGLTTWDTNLRNFGENFITSAAFLKLREVSLSYQFPSSLLSGTRFIKGATIALVGRNLLTFLPKENKYTDPEFNRNDSNAVGFNDTSLTPPTRTYGFSASLTF